MQSQDILFIVLAVCTIFISVPLVLILWRTYKMMERIDNIISYIDHVRKVALELESVPMKFVESIIGSLTKNGPTTKK